MFRTVFTLVAPVSVGALQVRLDGRSISEDMSNATALVQLQGNYNDTCVVDEDCNSKKKCDTTLSPAKCRKDLGFGCGGDIVVPVRDDGNGNGKICHSDYMCSAAECVTWLGIGDACGDGVDVECHPDFVCTNTGLDAPGSDVCILGAPPKV